MSQLVSKRIAGREAQLAAQPFIPALRAEHVGEQIEWRPR
ncbi:hypothetical protein BJ996_007048 [Streptomyces phaeogriseichromatogenes]|nr:hypothetical protein [Streptomyces murinus]